eukprot:8811671-Ditylum_brightwellii.AAC.1
MIGANVSINIPVSVINCEAGCNAPLSAGEEAIYFCKFQTRMSHRSDVLQFQAYFAGKLNLNSTLATWVTVCSRVANVE